VKKGMKIFVKRNQKVNPDKDTVPEDILVPLKPIVIQKEHHFHHAKEDEVKNLKTKLPPYSLMREIKLNEILLEGKLEQEPEADDAAGNKDASKKEDPNESQKDKKVDEAEEDDDEKNMYLQMYNYSYLSNIITTGTVSIVLTSKSFKTDMPNPCSALYGNILVEDEESELEELVPEKKDKGSLKRNNTIIPGVFNRQSTVNSKGMVKKSKTNNRIFVNKSVKKKARELEEMTDENILKKIITDIEEQSPFYQKEYMNAIRREQEEDKKLDEDENEDEEAYEESSDEDIEDLNDIFLDRNIDFDKEIKKA